ncbi:hypothetical protein BJV78DRAFT_955308 [Lactifluus subvellereus]|nr:hypothetical protein BJV78DRAFT_955308 [Lactifluus subvellereus]
MLPEEGTMMTTARRVWWTLMLWKVPAWTLIYTMRMQILALPPWNHISPPPPGPPTCTICCAQLHVARTGLSCATLPQMDGALHPLSQPERHPCHRSPVGHPCGVSRPAPEQSTLLTLHHDGAHSDAITLSQEEVDDSTAQTTGTAAPNTSIRATPKYDEGAIPPVLPIPPSGTTVEPRPRERHP